MIRYIKNHKIKVLITGIGIFGMIPAILYFVVIKVFPDGGNDWAGFLGNYVGTIVAACVAIYVLVKTLEENKKSQDREELVGFCNYLVGKVSMYAQKYEETLYEARPFLAIIERENASAEAKKFELDLYAKFVKTHHEAKVILYEIISSFEIRKNMDMYKISNLADMIQCLNATYEAFVQYETEVGKATKASDVDDERLVELVEKTLVELKQYITMKMEEIENGDKAMKTIKEIYNEVENNIEEKNDETRMKAYLEIVRKEVGNDRARLLVYKNSCFDKTDLNLPSFWMATGAMIVAVTPCLIGEKWSRCVFVGVLFMVAAYYWVVYHERKKYSLIALAVEEVEREMT